MAKAKTKNEELEKKLEPCIYCNRKNAKVYSGGSEAIPKCNWVVCMYETCGAEGPIKKTPLQAANIWNKTSKSFYKGKK